uniref:Uncharacterized protein n=1 Tax=Chromera velia CCMP2878 TaxID=1169474 RepID=A0A0G4GZV1_9ALVE|eukprot:Cvel_24073.t1-p1 / transcript=Cvel_24073.t1 / gene=Cvel_24073 / organism=Chromera_velia_CCMP2878 / gene_product=hypothetical protein / transcript_product=hypothetical protein / location=Cvel_scaffold2562:21673-22056(-) / protein_length=128 / sequence_SO=supercontig / SO=protein_coding / is_pseudo=false
MVLLSFPSSGVAMVCLSGEKGGGGAAGKGERMSVGGPVESRSFCTVYCWSTCAEMTGSFEGWRAGVRGVDDFVGKLGVHPCAAVAMWTHNSPLTDFQVVSSLSGCNISLRVSFHGSALYLVFLSPRNP